MVTRRIKRVHRMFGPDSISPESWLVYSMPSPRLLGSGDAVDYNGYRLTYPDIRLVYWCGGNPFHHHQHLSRLRRALGRPDTIVVRDAFWTSMARHADIVLPATVTLERNNSAAGFSSRRSPARRTRCSGACRACARSRRTGSPRPSATDPPTSRPSAWTVEAPRGECRRHVCQEARLLSQRTHRVRFTRDG